MLLTRLIYFSENQIIPRAGSILPVLSDILSKSNRNNKALGLTGALLFDDQWFLQALEGDRPTVWATYERIREDERHEGVMIAEFAETSERVFGNWWMGLATRYAKTEHIFQSLLAGGRFDPRAMSARQMMELMVSLSRVGLSRELAVTQAA